MIKMEVPEPEPMNMTPMIDVVFNLLIFFLLGSTYLNDDRQLSLELPRASSAAAAADAPDELVVIVLADGQLRLRDQPRTPAELEADLRAARANYPDQAVSIRGDRRVQYEAITQVLSACRKAGIVHVDCLVREEP